MDFSGKVYATGGDGKLGVSLALQGVDTVSTSVWIRFLGSVGRIDEDGGEHPCGVPIPYHREAGDTSIQRVMGDTGGRGGAMGGKDAVSGHIHRPLAGNGIIVGNPTTTLGALLFGKRL